MPRVFSGCRPIDDNKPFFLSFPKNDQIIDRAALVVKQHPVTAGMDRHIGDGHGDERVQSRFTAITVDQKFSHVAGVEKRDGLTGMLVFSEDPFVLHGHFPSAERDDARVEGNVFIVQRGLFEYFLSRGHCAVFYRTFFGL